MVSFKMCIGAGGFSREIESDLERKCFKKIPYKIHMKGKIYMNSCPVKKASILSIMFQHFLREMSQYFFQKVYLSLSSKFADSFTVKRHIVIFYSRPIF